MPLVDGIYQYDENDVVAPTFSDHLNKLGDSVRDALATQTTAWIPCALRSGFTGFADVCVVNDLVVFRAQITGAFAANVTIAVADVPAGYAPGYVVACPSMYSSGEFNWGNVSGSGVVSVRKGTAETRSVYLSAVWPKP